MSASTRRPARLNMRRWHKWVGIAIGLLLFGWVASGIIMLLPQSKVAKLAGVSEPGIDFAQVTLSPGQAASAAAAARGDTTADVGARNVILRSVLGTPVYLVTPKRGRPSLIDAATGASFEITAERAKTIGEQALGDLKSTGVELLPTAPSGYYGVAPVYRVTYDDGGNVVSLVSAVTGEMQRTQRADRIMTAIGHNFHVFAPFTQLPGGQNTRKGSLILTGIIALASIVTGYWLAIPRRWLKPSGQRPS